MILKPLDPRAIETQWMTTDYDRCVVVGAVWMAPNGLRYRARTNPVDIYNLPKAQVEAVLDSLRRTARTIVRDLWDAHRAVVNPIDNEPLGYELSLSLQPAPKQ